MYSIIQLCDKAYKVRYVSNNLEEIYKNYEILDSIMDLTMTNLVPILAHHLPFRH